MAFKFHAEDAMKEAGLKKKFASPEPPIAIFSHFYYRQLNGLNHDKRHDYCFIGSISSNYHARAWVVDFAKNHFTVNSIFINIDEGAGSTSVG